MEWLILLALLLLVVFAALAKKGGNADGLSYEKNEPLFSPAERSFFGVLSQAAKDNAVVLGKVRVADVLRPPKGTGRSNWQKAFNRISAKHFDYVICSPDTLSVLAAIELDDKSHNKGKRAERDRFLETACSGAGLPLHRFKAAATYNISEVRNVLFPPPEEVAEESSRTEAPDPEGTEEQFCPKCLLNCAQNWPTYPHNLHRILTHVQLYLHQGFAGVNRSDRRGVIKRNQTMAFPGRDADPRDNPKNRTE